MKARFRDEELSDEWVKQSEEWIGAHKQGPFFLFFASHDIHVPRVAHERFQGKSCLGPRGDCILEFDWCVGELMEMLDRFGIAEKTLVVLCSDNGPVLDDGYKDFAVEKLGDHQPTGPFSGGKYSVLEDGTRIPFIVRWTGHVKPAVSEQVVCTSDLAASFAALTGQAIAENQCLDSFNVMDALLGKPGAKGREFLIQQNNGGTSFGLRMGEWKLVRQKRPYKTQAVVTKKPIVAPTQLNSLYHLSDDPGETRDVSAEHPEVFRHMVELLDKLIADGRSTPGRPQPHD